MPSLNAPNRYRSPEQDAVVAAPDSLALPPRSIPWLVRARVLFGGMLNQFGWIWLAFSMIFVVVFIGGSGLKALFFNFATLETTSGEVLRVEETNSSENGRSIYEIRYIFRIDQRETEYYGVSYTSSYNYTEGQAVEVEYQPAKPANSRIRGARVSTFGLGVLFVLIFPLVGVFLLVGGVRLGIKGLRLLRMGNMAQGTLIRKESTSTRINEQMVYKLTFEFADRNGTRYQTSAKTHLTENLQDEDFERVLYDPANPHYAVLFDNLPGRPDVDALGRILPGSPLRSGLVMIFPALTLLITLLMFL